MIEIQLFGPTVVTTGARVQASDLGGIKPRQVLQLLALRLGTPVPKTQLAEELWDGRPPLSAIATLEGYVCALRRRLGLVGGRHSPLATSHHGYLLDPELVSVDLVRATRELTSDGVDVAPVLDRVGAVLLADEPYAAWACRARDDLDELVATTCTRRAEEANARADHAAAVPLAREAVRRSYLSEPAVRELMRALHGTGARAEALRAYGVLRSGLLEELGLEPGCETQQVYLEVLRDAGPATDLDRDEVPTLLQLLRCALDDRPDATLRGVPWVTEVGQLLLARAAI